MWQKIVALMVLLLVAGGCVLVHEPSYPLPLHPTHNIVYSDVEWVVWEYYDWDYEVVVSLHDFGYTSDETSLILFLAYNSRVEPRAIVEWHRSGLSWMEITTVKLHLEPTIFFVSIPSTVRVGPPYGNAYGHYWHNPGHIILTDAEMVDLVHLKVVSEAYNLPVTEVIKQREKGIGFNEIVREHRDTGKEFRSHRGRVIHTSDEPDQRRPDTTRPTPGTEKPKPDKDKPKPDKDKPDKDKPDKDKPDKDKPDKPDKDKPDKDKPDKDKPDKDKPDKDKPDKDKDKDRDKDKGKG